VWTQISIFGRRRRLAAISVLGIVALAGYVSSAGAQEAREPIAAAADGKLEELLLQVDINRQSLDETVLLLRDARGEFYVSEDDLRRWRLRIPAQPSFIRDRVSYYPLAAMSPLSLKFDATAQRLSLELSAQAFESTRLEAFEAKKAQPVKPSLGMFFNYDVNLEKTAADRQKAALFEAGAFNQWGVGTTSALWQQSNIASGTVRLESAWTTDMPERMSSLRLGDAINQPGAWGRAVRFGGIQYGTNFATQPGFVTLPLQSVSGQAVLPSTVNVYVNNALAAQQQVPPGPFAIRDLPVVTGSGDIRIVVRDLLGREQIITQSFYAGTNLLRKDLSDYSFEIGAARNNFGLASNDYGPGIAVGTYRHGWSDQFTSELHGELQKGQSTAGLSGAWLFPSFGILSATLAGSRSDRGGGDLIAVGFERSTQTISFRAHSQLASENFAQLGASASQPVPRRVNDAAVSVALGQFGSIGVAYVQQRQFDATETEVVSTNYGVTVGQWGFLNLALLHTLSEPRGRAASLSWTIPLGAQTSASLTRQTSSGDADGSKLWTARVQQGTPVGEGWGYALEASDDGSGRVGAQYQNRIGVYAAEAEKRNGEINTRVGAQGGVAVLGGAVFLSRRVSDSFALVNVPGIENVRVYADNQEVGRTDAQGNLLLPRLRPYDRNQISIEQLDLPLDTEIKGLSLDIAPYYRSGTVVGFPVRRVRSATLKLIQENGVAVPSDARVTMIGFDQTFPVGFDGTVFVSGLAESNRLRAQWDGKTCEFALLLPRSPDPQPDLGVVVCRDAKP
jgi:outer membrane usher protein